MSENASTPAPLPVIGTLRDAFQFVWHKRGRLLRALSIPMSVMLAVEAYPYILFQISDFEEGPVAIIFVFLQLLKIPFYIIFPITCHRLVLIEDSGIPIYGKLAWSVRETRFLLWCIGIYLFYAVLAALSPLALGAVLIPLLKSIQPSFKDLKIFLGDGMLGYLILLPATYCFARVSLILPATALDRYVHSGWAWDLSIRNGWRLTMLVGILPWVFALFQQLLLRENATLVEILIFLVISFLFLAVEIVLLSFSYKYLIQFEPKLGPPAPQHLNPEEG